MRCPLPSPQFVGRVAGPRLVFTPPQRSDREDDNAAQRVISIFVVLYPRKAISAIKAIARLLKATSSRLYGADCDGFGPLFKMVRGDWFLNTPNLYNTWWALIATYLTFSLPFTVWVLTNFFKAMLRELEEAALVDGAGPFRTFWQILLPLAAPGMVTTGLLAFIAAWNEFLFALTFTNNEQARTVVVVISQYAGNQQFELPFAKRMAAAMLVTLPLIALVLIFQRKIIAGLTAGAVKG